MHNGSDYGRALFQPLRKLAPEPAGRVAAGGSRRNQQSRARPNYGLNRIVGPAPALRQSLTAASESLGPGLSAALAAMPFRPPASPPPPAPIPPSHPLWSPNLR